MSKGTFLAFWRSWTTWFKSRRDSEILQSQVTWPHVPDTFMSNLILPYQFWQKKIHAKLGQVWILRIFHWKKNFLLQIWMKSQLFPLFKGKKAKKLQRLKECSLFYSMFTSSELISCHRSFSIPPEDTRKPDDFWCVQGLWKETNEVKWVTHPSIFSKL